MTRIPWTESRPRPRVSDAAIAFTGLAIAMLASLASLGCDRRPPSTAPILVPSPAPLPMPETYAATASSSIPEPAAAPHASAPVPELCITDGDVIASGDRATVREAKGRGFLAGSTGDSAVLEFTYGGRANTVAAMASGDTRAQLGLELRAQDSCNVIYVMWRIDPVSEITVQVKRNDLREHRDCGNAGYTRVRPTFRAHPPALGVADWPTKPIEHVLQAAIVDDVIEVFADKRLVWRGALPAAARDFHGPAGFRTDNVQIDLALRAPMDPEDAARCPRRAQLTRSTSAPTMSTSL